jgi:hypothetical protein
VKKSLRTENVMVTFSSVKRETEAIFMKERSLSTMKMSKRVHVISIILAMVCLLTLTSCAVKTEVQQVSMDNVRAHLKYQNVVFRNFTANPGVKAPEGPLMECRQSAIDYLELKRVFKTVEKDTGKYYEDPTMYVDVNVTSCRIVSGAARFWVGAMAGRSNINMDVKLTDNEDTMIAEKELIGAPNAFSSEFSFGGTDTKLPQKMGFLLGDFILAHASGE